MSGERLNNIQPTVDTRNGIIQELRSTLQYELPLDDILSAHRIGTKPPAQHPDKRKILLKLSNYSLKSDLLRSCRSSKPVGLFLNDNLTPIGHCFE